MLRFAATCGDVTTRIDMYAHELYPQLVLQCEIAFGIDNARVIGLRDVPKDGSLHHLSRKYAHAIAITVVGNPLPAFIVCDPDLKEEENYGERLLAQRRETFQGLVGEVGQCSKKRPDAWRNSDEKCCVVVHRIQEFIVNGDMRSLRQSALVTRKVVHKHGFLLARMAICHDNVRMLRYLQLSPQQLASTRFATNLLLDFACECGSRDCIVFLLYNINSSVKTQRKNNDYAMLLACSFRTSVINGHASIAAFIYSYIPKQQLDAILEIARVSLFGACKSGFITTATWVIRTFAVSIDGFVLEASTCDPRCLQAIIALARAQQNALGAETNLSQNAASIFRRRAMHDQLPTQSIMLLLDVADDSLSLACVPTLFGYANFTVDCVWRISIWRDGFSNAHTEYSAMQRLVNAALALYSDNSEEVAIEIWRKVPTWAYKLVDDAPFKQLPGLLLGLLRREKQILASVQQTVLPLALSRLIFLYAFNTCGEDVTDYTDRLIFVQTLVAAMRNFKKYTGDGGPM